jgi:hypothetical protein
LEQELQTFNARFSSGVTRHWDFLIHLTPIFGFSSGIALGTGSVCQSGPNTLPDAGKTNSRAGDSQLNKSSLMGKKVLEMQHPRVQIRL